MSGLILASESPQLKLCEIFRRTKLPLRLYYFKASAALAALGKQHCPESSALIKQAGTERAYLKTEFDLCSLCDLALVSNEYQSRSNLNKYTYKHIAYL